jgi:hypothetical protein
LTESGSFIDTNVGTLVYITVPGDIKEDARVTEFSSPSFSEYGPIPFHTIIANLSDIHVTPAGSIKVTNWLGGKTADIPLTQTNIFPNTAREFENVLDRKWLFGRYTATLNAGYGTTGQALSAIIFFWVIPWRLILLVIAALVFAFVIYTLVRRQQNETQPQHDDQVEELEKELEALKKKYKDR